MEPASQGATCQPLHVALEGGSKVPGELPSIDGLESACGELPSEERGDVGLEWCAEKEACFGGGLLPWAGSLGRSTLRLLKSRPGGMTLIRGIMRPARRLARSTASSFTSYLQAETVPTSGLVISMVSTGED